MQCKLNNKVLIVTGGLISAKETSLWGAAVKQYKQIKAAQSHWLETKIKVTASEALIYSMFKRKRDEVKSFFANSFNYNTPELTEVVLADLLHREGMPFEVITYDTLFSDKKKAETLLQQCNIVFASSTLLHDLSELMPLVNMLKTQHNKLVVGGALAGSLCNNWEGDKNIAVLAIGYGELIVPQLVKWINSGFTTLTANEGGRIVQKAHTQFYFSGVPETKNLDFLPTPNWKIAENYHQTKFKMINYESVRGCPYRCSFCNYPYLFDDTKFRFKSAEKMADDWEHYQNELGVEYITCLDSLFTMPKKRLTQFCNLIIERNIKIKWICYARADDLIDEATVALMKKAGAIQVQIGIESGNQMQLNNMNKQCKVESNLLAIENCKKHGITTMVSLIVGFPGETEETLADTFEFMKVAKPDFYFLATFSIRVDGVPILNKNNRELFGLKTMSNAYTFAPYWIHKTMSCQDVGNHVRKLNYKLMNEKIALEGSLFYNGILHYKVEQKEALLSYQKKVINSSNVLKLTFNYLNKWVDKKLAADLKNCQEKNQIN